MLAILFLDALEMSSSRMREEPSADEKGGRIACYAGTGSALRRGSHGRTARERKKLTRQEE
jgi:hypothetical protein